MGTVLRPRAALLMAVGLSVILVLATVLGWALLPGNVKELFTGPQLATLALFVLVMIAVMLGVGLSSVRADAHGLVIRNGVRTHQVPWRQVTGFRFTADDPWAYVLLCDEPGSRPLMALQRVDRSRAAHGLAGLKAALADYRRRSEG
ncbi:MAG: PH domain-containing protein [Propionicimonas sp.]|nr:PH domain-containing protein [Propionicimonas sp.]